MPELLPGLRLENGHYHLLPGNANFSPLVSTYLWRAFNEKESEQAFKNWITCLRVNCECQLDAAEVGEAVNVIELFRDRPDPSCGSSFPR